MMLRLANKVLVGRGLEKLDWSVLRYRRQVVKPFEAVKAEPRSRAVPEVYVVRG
jgi:hypothetical protein